MKISKKGNGVVAIILFIIGGGILMFSIMGFIGVNLLQGDIEEQKRNALPVEGVVYELRYDDSIRHYVADVVYEVNGEQYIVTIDTATSKDVEGTPMTVYCNPDNPLEVVDEWNTRETYNTYKAGFFMLAIGLAFIFGGLKAAGVIGGPKKQYDIDYSKHPKPSSVPNKYDPTIPYGQSSNPYDPNTLYTGESQSSYDPNTPYGSQSYNSYDPNTPYSQSTDQYDPNVPYGQNNYNNYNNNNQY